MVDVDARRDRCLVDRVSAVRLPGRLPAQPQARVPPSFRVPHRARVDPPEGADTLPDADQVGLAHERAARTNHAPDTAELGHVLAEDLTFPAIADVVIEGAARICDLQAAVWATRPAEEARLDAAPRPQPCLHDVR